MTVPESLQLIQLDPATAPLPADLLLINQGAYSRRITYAQLSAQFVSSDDFRLANNQFLVADNSAGDGDVSLIRATNLDGITVGTNRIAINAAGTDFTFNTPTSFTVAGGTSGVNPTFSCVSGDAIMRMVAGVSWHLANFRSDNTLRVYDGVNSSSTEPNITLKSRRVGVNALDPLATLHLTNNTNGAENSVYFENRNSSGTQKNLTLRSQNGNLTVRQVSNSRDVLTITDAGIIQALVNDMEIFRTSSSPVNFNVQNNGTGNATHTIRCVANGGDACTIYRVAASAVFWSAGIDYSDNQKYKICNANILGSNEKIVLHKNAAKLEALQNDIQYGGQSLLGNGITSENIQSGFVGNTNFLGRDNPSILATQFTYVYPPTGKILSNFLGGIVSARFWKGRGQMDANDTQRSYYELDVTEGAIKVWHQANDLFDTIYYNMEVNYLFFWS